MLELVGVVVTDGGVTRLNRCSFTVRAGEILGLVGPTGSGKSAALEVGAGHRSPDRGRVLLDGRDVTRRPARLVSASALLGHRLPGPHDARVFRWLETWSQLDGVPRKERSTRIREALERVGLDGATDRSVADLSRGQSRRLGLARIWVRRPTLFLLDAPDDGLDGHGLRALSSMVRAVAADGATVVLSSASPHFPSVACDRAILMRDGAVESEVVRGDAEFKNRIAAVQGWAT